MADLLEHDRHADAHAGEDVPVEGGANAEAVDEVEQRIAEDDHPGDRVDGDGVGRFVVLSTEGHTGDHALLERSVDAGVNAATGVDVPLLLVHHHRRYGRLNDVHRGEALGELLAGAADQRLLHCAGHRAVRCCVGAHWDR